MVLILALVRSMPASADDFCPLILAAAKTAYADEKAAFDREERAMLKRHAELVAQVRAILTGLSPAELALIDAATRNESLLKPTVRVLETQVSAVAPYFLSEHKRTEVFENCKPLAGDNSNCVFSIDVANGEIYLSLYGFAFAEKTTPAGIRAFLRDLQEGTNSYMSFEAYAVVNGLPAECLPQPKEPAPVAASDSKSKGDTVLGEKLAKQDGAQGAGAVK